MGGSLFTIVKWDISKSRHTYLMALKDSSTYQNDTALQSTIPYKKIKKYIESHVLPNAFPPSELSPQDSSLDLQLQMSLPRNLTENISKLSNCFFLKLFQSTKCKNQSIWNLSRKFIKNGEISSNWIHGTGVSIHEWLSSMVKVGRCLPDPMDPIKVHLWVSRTLKPSWQ